MAEKNYLNRSRGRALLAWILGGIVVAVLVIMVLSNSFILRRVEATEMGVVTRGGQLEEVVGPGTYTSFGFFKKNKLDVFSVAIIPLQSTDPEVLTKPAGDSEDESSVGMPVGFEIVGDIQPPIDPLTIKNNWARYGTMYKNPEMLELRVDSFTKEAMKVCAGAYTFYEITAERRTEFATCISNTVTDKVYEEYKVTVTNVTIANIILSEQVLARINAVIDLQQQVDLEKQQAELATATGERQEAENTASIQAEMATKIEQAKQDKLLAAEEALKILAQQEVVQAEIDLISLQQELAEEQLVLAAVKAQENLSAETYMAELIASNPSYLSYLIAQLNAQALQNVSKLIIAEEGSVPQLILGADSVGVMVDGVDQEIPD
ncbi:MAG: SPFH domain-containing protein [Anaerolineae bacterium]|jgi:regulator of protease activity HflC (stomatin/prohibitin superfamily)|nr:SPFH domain-containing protein [Anaerolineae bacterium]